MLWAVSLSFRFALFHFIFPAYTVLMHMCLEGSTYEDFQNLCSNQEDLNNRFVCSLESFFPSHIVTHLLGVLVFNPKVHFQSLFFSCQRLEFGFT